MGYEITLTINNDERTMVLEEDIMLSSILAQLASYQYQYTNCPAYPTPFWVLVDNRQLFAACSTSAVTMHNKSILTFSYAYTQEIFQYIIKHLLAHGVVLDTCNAPFIVFTLFLWYRNKNKVLAPQQRAMTLMKLYPHIFTQPAGFVYTYKTLVKEEKIHIPTSSSTPPSLWEREQEEEI